MAESVGSKRLVSFDTPAVTTAKMMKSAIFLIAIKAKYPPTESKDSISILITEYVAPPSPEKR